MHRPDTLPSMHLLLKGQSVRLEIQTVPTSRD
jgi:hypothetical protein